MRKKLTIKVLLVAMLLALPLAADARNWRFDLIIRFFFAISIEDVVPIDYGVIAYNGNTAGTDIKIEPSDSSITCTNSTDYTCPASGVRGSFRITGFPGQPVEVSCDDDARMALSNQNLDIVDTEVRVGGTDYACAGINNVSASHIISGAAINNTFYMGATIEVPNTGLALLGAYSTTNPSGNAIKVRVRYQ